MKITESEKLSNIATGVRLRCEPTTDFKVYIVSTTTLYCKKVGSNVPFLKYF